MGLRERQVEQQRGASVVSDEFQSFEGPAAEVYHEGSQVRIRVKRRLDQRALVIPLRNGFPLYAADRTAQCFTVLDSQARRAATAIRVPDFGLHVMFDTPPVSGDYFILTQTPVGRA